MCEEPQLTTRRRALHIGITLVWAEELWIYAHDHPFNRV